MFLKNKQASIAIVLLVVLVLVVSSATMFALIINSGKIEAQIQGSGVLDVSYLKQERAEFYLRQAVEKSVVKSYEGFVKDDNYIESPKYIGIGDDIEFEVLKDSLNEDFKLNFILNFKNEFKSYVFEEDYLNELKGFVDEGEFKSSFNGESLQLNISEWEIQDNFKDIDIKYKPKINLDVGLNDIWLDSFNEIYNVKEDCGDKENVEELKNCFDDGLDNFDINVEKKTKSNDEKYFLVTLTSKNEFLIGEGLEKVEFGFVGK